MLGRVGMGDVRCDPSLQALRSRYMMFIALQTVRKPHCFAVSAEVRLLQNFHDTLLYA